MCNAGPLYCIGSYLAVRGAVLCPILQDSHSYSYIPGCSLSYVIAYMVL